ncbi:MAG: glycosyltransferase family 4 protein, partial [Janthinobacterium lividum]
MALGTPVLTSSAGALAEVAGEAALRVDPQDGAAIAQGLRALDADDLRARLAASGLAQAAAYTPAAYADRLDRLYRGVRARS